MEKCPECRTPIHSMMLLKGDTTLELYCGTCNRGWPIPKRSKRAQRTLTALR